MENTNTGTSSNHNAEIRNNAVSQAFAGLEKIWP